MIVRQPAGTDVDFDAYFRSLYPAARSLAYRILGNPVAAEDAAAEAFARACARWPRVARLPYRDAWLLRVTTNVALDHVRKRDRVFVADADLSIDGHEELVALRSALACALSALPGRQREAIALIYLGGLSPTEVASSMGVSASSVSQHTRRGLQRLRTSFDEDVVTADLGGGADVEI